MPKVKVPWLCSRSQPVIKVIIRDIRGHLLHTVTFLVQFIISRALDKREYWMIPVIKNTVC